MNVSHSSKKGAKKYMKTSIMDAVIEPLASWGEELYISRPVVRSEGGSDESTHRRNRQHALILS